MSGEKCCCRDCERTRDRCYCRQCERGRDRDRDRCRDKSSCASRGRSEGSNTGVSESYYEGRRRSPEEYDEKPKEPTVIIQKYAPDCEKSCCDDQTKTIVIHNDNIIYITIR